MICFEKRFDNVWADLKIKFDHKATFHYIEVNTLTNTEFNNELSVEANTICTQYKTCELIYEFISIYIAMQDLDQVWPTCLSHYGIGKSTKIVSDHFKYVPTITCFTSTFDDRCVTTFHDIILHLVSGIKAKFSSP